jgi:hypothetical protein
MGKVSLSHVTVSKVVDSNIFKFLESLIDLIIICITLLESRLSVGDVVNVSVHRNHSFGDKRVENVAFFAITGQFTVVSIFRNLEVKSIFLKNL